MNKTYKKIKDSDDGWDFEEMLEEYGISYLDDVNPEDAPQYLSEADVYVESQGLEWVLNRVLYGGQWFADDYQFEKFDAQAEYFVVNGYGNWFSLDDYHLPQYLKWIIEEDEFKTWCLENGYFEPDYDEEDEVEE